MDLLVLNTFTCAAEFIQVAAIEALRDATNSVDAMVAEYRLRRDLFVQSLSKIPGFRCHSPEGAFYAWVNIEDTGLPRRKCKNFFLKKWALPPSPAPPSAFTAKTISVFRWSVLAVCSKTLSTVSAASR